MALSPKCSRSSAGCSKQRAIWTCGGCPNCSAGFRGAGSTRRRSIRSRACRKPGRVLRYSPWFRRASVSDSIQKSARYTLIDQRSPNSSTSCTYADCGQSTAPLMCCYGATTATLRSISHGGKAACPLSCRVEGSKADVQIRDDGAKIGLGLGGPLPERTLHPAYTLSGPVGHRPPRRRSWQCSEQAFVKEIINAMILTAKRRPVVARGGQDDAIGLRHFAGGKAAAVAGGDDHYRRHSRASPRQRLGKLIGAERSVRAGEPHTGAALAMRGQEDQAPISRPSRQRRYPLQKDAGKRRLDRCSNLGSAGTETVDISSRHASSGQALAQCAGRVVEYRLGVIAGGENHLPPRGRIGRRRCSAGLDREHAQHE